MADVQAHRGPDGSGIFIDVESGVGLAHRRLSIIDPSPAGAQPMWDLSGRVVIAFNGEIYNFRELALELTDQGYKFRSRSDTEVILNLYLRDGVACVDRLNGIFSFAIWDTQERRLFIARDEFGVKPLYVATTARGVAFASEIKALCCLGDLDRTCDVRALADYLTYLYCPAPRTAFRAVSKMMPGECMIITQRGVASRWRFVRRRYAETMSNVSVDDASDELVFQLKRAVKRQMIADVPVGAFLSGGLDSSSVVAFARDYANVGELSCFTVGFAATSAVREGLTEDLPFATKVASHLNVALDIVWVDNNMWGQLDKMIWHLDEPLGDPAALNVLAICELARKQGMKVLLSGAGGDDVLTGYRRHRALMEEQWWGWLPPSARSWLRMLSELPSKSSPIGRRLSKAFQYADLSPDERLVGYFAWLRHEKVVALFNPDIRSELEGYRPLDTFTSALSELPGGTSRINKMLYLDSRFFLADHNLNYTDKMSMAAGVETRVPFLDPDFVRFADRLPTRYKQRGGIGKWIFKRAMTKFLPKDVVYRPKTGFGVPLRSWLRGGSSDIVDVLLSESALKDSGIFDSRAIKDLVAKNHSGAIDASYSIFEVICIQRWLQLFGAHI